MLNVRKLKKNCITFSIRKWSRQTRHHVLMHVDVNGVKDNVFTCSDMCPNFKHDFCRSGGEFKFLILLPTSLIIH